jgi:hypothetical protein
MPPDPENDDADMERYALLRVATGKGSKPILLGERGLA